MRRHIGTFSLTISAITCIIGSGWLFGAYYATKYAGPASIVSWLIGGIIILLIAMTTLEVGTLIPKSGGMVRYLEYTHGSFAGFINAWANWLGVVAVIPIEAEASVQYLSAWHIPYASGLFDAKTDSLTTTGLIVAVGFLLLFFLLNFWSLRLFLRSMVALTVVKIMIPCLTVIFFMWQAFHPSNFTAYHHTLFPYGFSGVLTAIISSGIIMSFNGFQSPINLAGEAKDPKRGLPIAVIVGITIPWILYLLLDITYIGAVSPQKVAMGWKAISFSSPFADLAIALNLNVLVWLLFFDAVVSPTGTGLTYMATTTRMLLGMQRNGYMPHKFGEVNQKTGIPRYALFVNLLLSVLFLFSFRGWGQLVAIISVAHVISYIPGPIALVGLRKLAPKIKRPFRLAFANILAPLCFIIISWLFYWTRWPLTGEINLVILISLSIFLYYQHKAGWAQINQHIKGGVWLIVYLALLSLISFLGAKAFGGIGLIPSPWDHVLIAIVALICFYWSVKSVWTTAALRHALDLEKRRQLD